MSALKNYNNTTNLTKWHIICLPTWKKEFVGQTWSTASRYSNTSCYRTAFDHYTKWINMQQHIMYVYHIDAPVQPLAPLVVVAMNVNARIAVQLSLGGDIVLVCSSFVLFGNFTIACSAVCKSRGIPCRKRSIISNLWPHDLSKTQNRILQHYRYC